MAELYTYRPVRIFSRTCVVEGFRETAYLTTRRFTRRGSISIDDKSYEIQKHGISTGLWTVDDYGRVVVSGQKTSAFKRKYEIHSADGIQLLRAKSPFTREFILLSGETTLANFRPKLGSYRKADIQVYYPDISLIIVSFCTWLASVSWKGYDGN